MYLGRSTISVDQVAEQGQTDMPLVPVMMYLNGIEVPTDMLQQVFNAVLEPLKKSQPELDAA